MMDRPLYEKIQKLRPIHLQMQEMPQLEGVGGNHVPTLGSTEVGVDIGAGSTKPLSWLVQKGKGPILSLDLICLPMIVTCLFLIGKRNI